MKNLLLSLLFVTLLSQNSIGQNWTFYKDFPVNVSPKDITSNNAGTLFMLTQDNKLFYKTINGQWAEMPMTGAGFNPKCITVDKTSNFLFFGDDQSGLFYTSNFGATWGNVYVTTGSNTGFHEGVSALSNMKNFNILYGGGFGGTDNNGNLGSFITKYTPTSTDMYVFDPSDIWGNSTPEGLIYTENQKLIIGTFNNGIWITADNGASFQQTNFNQYQVRKFTEDTTGRVYGLGTDLSTNTDFLIYSDDYINWSTMLLPNDSEKYTTIYFDTVANNLWLGSQNGIYKILVTPTSTTAWSSASFNNGIQYVAEIIGTNNGSIYNFSNQNISQKLNVTGNNWSNINAGLHGSITGLEFGANNKLFAFNNWANSIVSTATSSTDPWINNTIINQNGGTGDVISRPNGKIYVHNYGIISKSFDNGLTFSDITPPNLSMGISKFYVGEDDKLFMVDFNEQDKLYWSQDDGQSWEFLHTFPSANPEFGSDSISNISQDSNGVIYVTMESMDQFFNFFQVFYSTNNGLTWGSKVFFDEDSNGFGTLFSKNDKTFVTIGSKTYRFDYSLPTNNFTAINRPPDFITQQYYLNYLTVNNLGYYYVFGDNLYKSTDEGTTWINLGKPSNLTSSSVNEILFDSNNQAYILAGELVPQNQRGIYTVTETLGTENPNLEYQIVVLPNPVQTTLNIQSQEVIREFSIYDLLGKKMSINKVSANSIDVSGLSSGIYIIKAISENNKTFISKFIKQ